MQGRTNALGRMYQRAVSIISPKQNGTEQDMKDEAAVSRLEKEVDMLLQECEALRSEALVHLEAQYQLANISLLLLAGIAAAAGLLFGLNAPNLKLPPQTLYTLLLYLVLIGCFLFSSLLHAFLSHQHDLGLIGVYINENARVRLRLLLEKKDGEDIQFFSWDYFHQQRLTTESKWSNIASLALTTAHLGVEAVLAILMIAIFLGVYIANISFFFTDVWGWVAVGFFFIDVAYILIAAPVGVETVGLFRQITQNHPANSAKP